MDYFGYFIAIFLCSIKNYAIISTLIFCVNMSIGIDFGRCILSPHRVCSPI